MAEESKGLAEGISNLPEVSDKEETAKVLSIVDSLVSDASRHNLLLHAIQSKKLPDDLTNELAGVLLRKMKASSRETLIRRETGGYDDLERHLWLYIVKSISIVLVGSFLTLAGISVLLLVYSALLESKMESLPELQNLAQMLLTIFTTAVGFMSGLITPNPLGKMMRRNEQLNVEGNDGVAVSTQKKKRS